MLSEDDVRAFRRRACDASIAIFGDLGYEQFSLRVLARELGCSHATPYRYFSGKEEIFAEVRAEGFRRFAAFLTARLAETAGGRSRRSHERRLRALARAYYDFAQEQPEAFRVIFGLGQPEADAYPFVQEAAGAAWGVVLGVVRGAVEAGLLVGSVSALAHVMWAGIHGVATLKVAHKLNMGKTGPALVDAMIGALITAHAAPAARASRAA